MRPFFSTALIAILCFAPGAHAHKASDSYLVLDATAVESVLIEWSILVRDLEVAVGLDSNRDGQITRREFDASAAGIATYALRTLSVATDAGACSIGGAQASPRVDVDQPMARLRATARCAGGGELVVGYGLLFDLDASHRGLLRLVTAGGEQTAIFSPNQAVQRFALDSAPATSVWNFIREGFHHILIGYDHIAFLILLLLPAAMVRGSDGWQPVERYPAIALDVLRVVTAFTVAHSLTLGLAATGILRIPVPVAELVIALSVVAAALANFIAFPARQRWMLAFGFGMVHGFGFASVFGELGVTGANLLPVLLAFNVGVEFGQLAIVAALLPLIVWLSRRHSYQRLGFNAVSAAIAALGLVWVIQRV